ncbi:hypothetical protein FSP39_015011 [Pinctada imbricata]|uniref:TNFR-Cys domain-containing protein n=1 Tax=Pinctada imbricata TaxID=66713 RepID=A0AA88YF51_PINIB|nr:hypothetical protein FSP39_015011 [Pinctada imbricata]
MNGYMTEKETMERVECETGVEVIFTDNDQPGWISFELNTTDPYGIMDPDIGLSYRSMTDGLESSLQLYLVNYEVWGEYILGTCIFYELDLPPNKARDHGGKVRSYSENPSLKAISMEGDSMTLVKQLQIVGVHKECKGDLSHCEKFAVCDTLQGKLNCRCKRGYYLQDKQCKECATSCPDGFFMINQCSANTDAVCQACTTCSGSRYTAAPCSTTQDTICIDVSFPMDHVNWNSTVAEDDTRSVSVSASSNVFIEKLRKMKDLNMKLFFPNNQQQIAFPYLRESGLEVKIKISQTYIVPEYVDLEHLDDIPFFNADPFQTAETKKRMTFLRENYCRSVIPDKYKILLEIVKNQYTVAGMKACDGTSACPHGYKQGEMYLDRDIYKKCPINDGKSDSFTPLRKASNAIFCPLTTDLLTRTFGLPAEEVEQLTFPTPDCKRNTEHCQACTDTCLLNNTGTADDSLCCKATCYSQDICQKTYSDECPVRDVKCSRGDVYAYFLEPMFEKLNRKFMCHLKYRQPAKLYQIEYEVLMPSIQHTLNRRILVVKPENKSYHEHGSATSDYITATHDTLPKIHDEVIVVGNRFRNLVPTRFSLHKLKEPEEFDSSKKFNVQRNKSDFSQSVLYSVHAQFEKPFLYSSITWPRTGCFAKNYSQIYPPQHLYTSDALDIEPTIIESGGQFVYQTSEWGIKKNSAINVFINGSKSILSYYQDDFKDTRIASTSLRGDLVWIKGMDIWNFTVSGTLEKCPGYLTMDVYDQFMEAKLAHFDVFIKCPVNFTITNSIRRQVTVSPEIFVIYINDYHTVHKVFLSEMLGPTNVPLQSSSIVPMESKENFPWLPIILSLVFTGIVLIIFLGVAIYISKIKIVTTDDIFKYPGVTFINKEDQTGRLRSESSNTTQHARPISRKIRCVLLTLYIMYAFTFTFSMLLGVFYMVQGPLISNLTIVSNTSAKIHQAVDTQLHSMEKFENHEMTRLFNDTYDRLRACAHHGAKNLESVTNSVQVKIDEQIQNLYIHNKTLYTLVIQTVEEKSQLLRKEMDKFVKQYNTTIQNHFESVLVKYNRFLETLIKNDWLAFPEERFISQKEVLGDNSGREHLLNFMSWLEVGKVEDTLGVSDKVIDRLSRTLPDLDKDFLKESFTPKTYKSNVKDMEDSTFKFHVLQGDSVQQSYSLHSSNRSLHYESDAMDALQSKASLINKMGEILLPVFICVFLLMDLLMLAYRFSWLREMYQKARLGVEEKVPTDHVAGKIHFTLTGHDNLKVETPLDKPYNYLMDNKSEVFAGKSELYLMYCRASPKSKDDILREIWTHKQRQKQKITPPLSDKKNLESKLTTVVKFLYKHLISPIFWRFVLVGAFVLGISVVIKATNDLVSIETATFLMDAKSIFPQLHHQTEITNTLLSEFLTYSTNILEDFKSATDEDLNVVTSVLRSSLWEQNQAVSSQISDLCSMSGVPLCNADLALPSFQTSLLQCNFLPLHVNFLKDFENQSFVNYLHTELYPLVRTLRYILFNMCYILFVFACLMLICHIFIRVIIFYLIKTNRLPKAMMYLVSNANDCWKRTTCPPPDSYYRSNSLIESCESGVVGDIDDTCYRDPATLISTERRPNM